jgi:hypothetical protein
MTTTNTSLDRSTQFDVETTSGDKESIRHSEYRRGGLSADDAAFLDSFPEEKKKIVVRKVLCFRLSIIRCHH